MISKTQTDDTQQQSQAAPRVKVHIKEHPAGHEEEHGDFLDLQGAPFQTGKKDDPGSHEIVLRNFTPYAVRFCFIARDNTPITNFFTSRLNADSAAHTGWVQIDAPASGQGFRELVMELSDSAFTSSTGTPQKRRIGISAKKLSVSGPCAFEIGDTPNPGDIVIDAGN